MLLISDTFGKLSFIHFTYITTRLDMANTASTADIHTYNLTKKKNFLNTKYRKSHKSIQEKAEMLLFSVFTTCSACLGKAK